MTHAFGKLVGAMIPARRQGALDVDRLPQMRPALLGMRRKVGDVVRVELA